MTAEALDRLAESGTDCAMAATALAFVFEPETWPVYVRWLRTTQPAATADLTDDELRTFVAATLATMSEAAVGARAVLLVMGATP